MPPSSTISSQLRVKQQPQPKITFMTMTMELRATSGTRKYCTACSRPTIWPLMVVTLPLPISPKPQPLGARNRSSLRIASAFVIIKIASNNCHKVILTRPTSPLPRPRPRPETFPLPRFHQLQQHQLQNLVLCLSLKTQDYAFFTHTHTHSLKTQDFAFFTQTHTHTLSLSLSLSQNTRFRVLHTHTHLSRSLSLQCRSSNPNPNFPSNRSLLLKPTVCAPWVQVSVNY